MKNDIVAPGAALHMELQLAESLLVLLQQEQQGLIDADTRVVMSLLEEKSRLVAGIRPLSNARLQMLGAGGHVATEAGMQAWLATQPQPAALARCWARLRDISLQAREINRINGLLIHRHLIRNQAAIDVLQGNPAHSRVYGPDGQPAQRQPSRSRVVG